MDKIYHQGIHASCLPTVRFASWGGKSVVTRRCRRIWFSWFRVVCFSAFVMGSGGMILSYTNGHRHRNKCTDIPNIHTRRLFKATSLISQYLFIQDYRLGVLGSERSETNVLECMWANVGMSPWWEHRWRRGWQSWANGHERVHPWPVMPVGQLYPQTRWSADPRSWRSSVSMGEKNDWFFCWFCDFAFW